MSTAEVVNQQDTDAARRLEQIASSIEPSRPLLDQTDTIHRFFTSPRPRSNASPDTASPLEP